MSLISTHPRYGNPRAQAKIADSRSEVGGLSGTQIEQMAQRFEEFMPELASNFTKPNNRSILAGAMPPTTGWGTRTGQTMTPSGGNRTMVTQQTPYQPEFASPDRQQYPVHRILANRYWRLFYKLDPVIGNCIEMYSDLPWSNFELTGEGVEGEIRQGYEHMCKETQLLALLPYFIREFLTVGEVIPHCFFDSDKGLFTYIALHNPDQVEVVDAPFIKMEPVMQFIPDDRLRAILTSNAPELAHIKSRIPQELMGRLLSNQNIPLSPVNATFIPRKLHPYDTRGTSIMSRLWRILMLEDAVFNATIQTARRHAGPLKVAKLGNAATGWIPPPDQERRLAELLAQAELDPQAWLIYHYGIAFETIGTTDRMMSIDKQWETIERIKLVGLGISKSFLHGEVSYASSATGLQVFLQRLKAMRTFFEQKWIYPKFFRPIAEINGWIKPKPSQVAHNFRVKRSSRELAEDNAYIIPKIIWDKTLDPQINNQLIQAMTSLEQVGVKFSKTSKMATVGYSYEEETKKIHRETEFEASLSPVAKKKEPAGPGGGGGGGGGDEMPPPPGDKEDGPSGPPPGGPPGAPPGGGDGSSPPGLPPPPTPPSPAGAALSADKNKGKDAKDKSRQELDPDRPGASSNDKLKSKIWVRDRYGNWDADEVADLIELMTTLDTDSAFWSKLGDEEEFKKSTVSGDTDAMFDAVTEYLEGHGYPQRDIRQLKEILTAERVISSDVSTSLDELESMLPEDASSLQDEKFAELIAEKIKRTQQRISDASESFLSGVGEPDRSNLLGDISDLMGKNVAK